MNLSEHLHDPAALAPDMGLDGMQGEPYRSPVYVGEKTHLLLQRFDPWAVHLFEQRQ